MPISGISSASGAVLMEKAIANATKATKVEKLEAPQPVKETVKAVAKAATEAATTSTAQAVRRGDSEAPKAPTGGLNIKA